MRILLVGEVLRFRSFNGANKALPVLASCLHNGEFPHTVQMDLERRDLSIDDVCREALRSDLVAFAGCMSPQWPELDTSIVRVYDALAQEGLTSVPIVVGGYAAKSVEDIARASPWITAFFNGEGEGAILQIAEAVASGLFLQKRAEIPGICYIDADGAFHHSTAPRVARFDTVDQAFGFVHVPQVHDMDIFQTPVGRQLKTAQIFTQRGCPWNCGYCNKSTEGNHVARLREDSLHSQLSALKRLGFEAIYLDVDTFTVNRAAAEREASTLGEYGFVWGSNTRVDQIDAALMRHCVNHGCTYLFFGVEHIDPGVGLAIGKFNGSLAKQIQSASQYPSDVIRVFREMRSAGLPSSYFIILGLPKAILNHAGNQIVAYRPTTFEEDLEAVRFGLHRCDPDYLNLNVLRFMPGTIAADTPHHPAYSCVRSSGNAPITAGWFLPRVAEGLNYRLAENHSVYRLCESVGANQPTTTALDPQRVYETMRVTMSLINGRIDQGQRATKLFVERELFDAGLVSRDDAGRYWLAPFSTWDAYRQSRPAVRDRSETEAFERAASVFRRSTPAGAATLKILH
jgi:anaerobic magnesium-protoporphyrin IX monomethyl ester cyclase